MDQRCGCGCAAPVRPGRRFRQGHNKRLTRGQGRRGLGAVIDGPRAYIPLRRADGSPQTWTVIDAADLPLLDDRAFSLTAQGYAARNMPGMAEHARELLHRILLGLKPGDKRQADHINGNRLDNRRTNLRIVTSEQSSQNRARPSGKKRGRHRYKGVAYHGDPGRRKRWQAVVTHRRKLHSGGYYKTQREAGKAAAELRRRLHSTPAD